MVNSVMAYRGNDPYVFISYAHRDAALVIPVIATMQQRGYRVWFDEGIDPGTEWDENIAMHVESCDCFIAMISGHYLASDNCCDELSFARDRKKTRLLIYLENVELPYGMAMRLNRQQAIHKYRYPTEGAFYDKLFDTPCLDGSLGQAASATASSAFTLPIAPATFPPAQITAVAPITPPDPRYTILEEIGRGANCTVYKAIDRELQQPVALKIINAFSATGYELLHNPQMVSLLQTNPHSNLPLLHTAHLRQGNTPDYITTEFIEGNTLSLWLLKQPSFSMRASCLCQLCHALSFLHQMNLVYGDLAPENVMLSGSQAFLVDYSTLRFTGARIDPANVSTFTEITRDQRCLSPEYLHHGELTPASDIYAMGHLVQQVLMGSHGYCPALPENANADLRRLIHRATQPLPADRYESMDALYLELMSILRQNPDVDDALVVPSYRRPVTA